MLGTGVSYQFSDQVRSRLTWLGWALDNDDRVDTATLQLILEF